MAPRKGVSGNPNGRKKGVPNKITTSLKTSIEAFLREKWPEVNDIWRQLEPKDKLAFFEKLMKYSVPTLQAVAVDARIDTSDKIQQLDDEQLNVLIDQILLTDGEEEND